jgi:hypothetical protein
MEDNEFWIKIWKSIGAVVCVLIISVSGCTMNKQYQTRMLIENTKVNPIDANCAIEGYIDRSGPCILRAAK